MCENIIITEHMNDNILDYCNINIVKHQQEFKKCKNWNNYLELKSWIEAYLYYLDCASNLTVEEAVKLTDNKIIQLTNYQIKIIGKLYVKQGYNCTGLEKIREKYGF